MGQYGNQPDFGTSAQAITPAADPSDITSTVNLNPAALYIGTGGTLVCRVVGGNTALYSASDQSGYTIFNNIPDGTFFPVIVSAVWANDGGEPATATTCSDIVALY
jgi:hypothetical protein